MHATKKILLGFSIFFGTLLLSIAYSAPQHTDHQPSAEMILHYVNLYRAKHHLSPLKLSAAVSKEATQHSQAMANRSTPVGHAHFNDRIQRLYKHFDHCGGAAENVAYWRANAKALVDGWIASPGHRRNLEGHYNVTGIGIAHGKPGWGYYTQIFLRTDTKRYASRNRHPFLGVK